MGLECVLCKQEIQVDANGWTGGHTAQPCADGRCCEKCNWDTVIPQRMRDMLR